MVFFLNICLTIAFIFCPIVHTIFIYIWYISVEYFTMWLSFQVAQHKTYAKHGPSCIVLDAVQHDQLLLWIDARNQIWDSDEDYWVFTTKNGLQLGSGDASQILKKTLQDKHASPTKIRKLIVSMASTFFIVVHFLYCCITSPFRLTYLTKEKNTRGHFRYISIPLCCFLCPPSLPPLLFSQLHWWGKKPRVPSLRMLAHRLKIICLANIKGDLVSFIVSPIWKMPFSFCLSNI